MIAGQRVWLTARETWEQFGGWRFGLPVAQLLPYAELKVKARISSKMARALERVGRDMRADPSLWYGSLEPVNVDRCLVQRLDVRFWQWRDA